MNNDLGQRITRLRNMKNLTQDQLAEKVGVSRQAISNGNEEKVFLTSII